jgi:hypothetical protein
VKIESKRLFIEKERLDRLEVEKKKRLENEQQKIEILQQRNQIYLSQLGIQFVQQEGVGQSTPSTLQ